jgi:hydroxymethylpyrimidine pyrophosphatase-like HAD family hydrolase
MLEAAGIGVVVANGTEASKAVADHVTEKTNNQGAVAEAVRRFALR